MEQEGKKFCLSVAGHNIEIKTLYSEAYNLCKEYITQDTPEFELSISPEDINKERTEIVNQGTKAQGAYLETLAVYRKIAEKLLYKDILLMHGAVIGFKDRAFMFTAASGTGKTTHIKKWLVSLKESYVVNGDKPLIKLTGNEVIACGTPWCGKEKMGRNCMVPLNAIVLMKRGEKNEIHEITFSEAFSGILQQTYMPKDPEKMIITLSLLSKLSGRVRFYDYTFNNMKDDAFQVAYNSIVI